MKFIRRPIRIRTFRCMCIGVRIQIRYHLITHVPIRTPVRIRMFRRTRIRVLAPSRIIMSVLTRLNIRVILRVCKRIVVRMIIHTEACTCIHTYVFAHAFVDALDRPTFASTYTIAYALALTYLLRYACASAYTHFLYTYTHADTDMYKFTRARAYS